MMTKVLFISTHHNNEHHPRKPSLVRREGENRVQSPLRLAELHSDTSNGRQSLFCCWAFSPHSGHGTLSTLAWFFTERFELSHTIDTHSWITKTESIAPMCLNSAAFTTHPDVRYNQPPRFLLPPPPQLELEEEKRIAAEMALNRLRRKAAERRRRASLSRSNSPMGGEGGRIGSGSPRYPGSPDNGDTGTGGGGGGGDGDGSPTRGRRPSILQVCVRAYVCVTTSIDRAANRLAYRRRDVSLGVAKNGRRF